MADVNLSVEVRSSGAKEAADAIDRLAASGQKFSRLEKDVRKFSDALGAAGKGSSISFSGAEKAAERLSARVATLTTQYRSMGSVLVGATASERLSNFGGGSLEQGIARARLLQQQLQALNSNPLKDLEALDQARESRLGARANLERSRWQASLQGMSANEQLLAQLTRAEREYAAAQRQTSSAMRPRGAGGQFVAHTEEDLRKQTAALNNEAQALDRVTALRARYNAMVERSKAGVASASAGLRAAELERELATMTPMAAAQTRLTHATQEYAAAKRAAATATATAERSATPDNLDKQASATKRLTQATLELDKAKAGLNAQTAREEQARNRATQGLASAQGRLRAAEWERELAAMTPVEAAQARLTRATQEYSRAKLGVVAADRAARTTGGTAVIDQQAQATDRLARATTQLQQAESGINQERSRSANDQNAFQSSYSYFILAGLAQQATSKMLEFGGAAVSASMQVERSFADTERTFEGTGSQLDSLKRKLYELSTDTPVSIIDLSHIATLGNQLGIAEEHIEKFTETIAQYSAVSGVTAEDAATAFGRVSNLTGIAASEYDKLASSITYTARTTVATESTIQSTAKEITALASGAGFSASAIVGLAGALSSLAIPPERARGALSLYFGALNTAVSSGGPKMKAFAELTNMTVQELDNLVRSNQGEKVFTSFIAGLSQLDTVAKTDALKTLGLGTIRVDQTMRALAQNVPLVTKSLEGAHGAYEAGADLMGQYGIIQDTLNSKWIQFQNAVFNASGALSDGGGLSDALKGVLSMLTEVVVAATEFANTPIGQAFLTVATAAGIVVTALSALVGVLAVTKAGMVVLKFAVQQMDWGTATSGLKLWTANLVGMNTGMAATGVTAKATASGLIGLNGATLTNAAASNTAAGGQLRFRDALAQSTKATFTGANAMRALSAAWNFAWPLIAITAATAAIQALWDMAQDTINPVRTLGASVDDLKQALIDDNMDKMSKGVDDLGVNASSANSKIDPFNQSILAAIDVQRQAESQIEKTNSALSGQEFALGASADAWIDEALKQSDALKDIIDGRDGAESFWEGLTQAAGTKGKRNKTNLMTSSADAIISQDEFYALIEAGMPIKEWAKIAATHGEEAANEAASEWQKGFAKANPEMKDTSFDFVNAIAPSIFAGLADGFKKARVEAALMRSEISETGLVADSAADWRELNTAVDSTAFTFEGATDRLDDFRSAVSEAMQGFVGFDTVMNRAAEAAQKLKDEGIGDGSVDITGFQRALTDSISDASKFYSDVTQLASEGGQVLAIELAKIGPEAQGVLSGALSLGPDALATLEADARFAGFLASKAFADALEENMVVPDEALGQIFSATGSLDKVKEAIRAGMDGTFAEFEKNFMMEYPDVKLGVTPELQDITPEQIQIWKDIAEGAIEVKATVQPGSRTVEDAIATSGEWQEFIDSATGASIIVPASLDEGTLTAGLNVWRNNQNATPEELAAKLEEAGLTDSFVSWALGQPPQSLKGKISPSGLTNSVNNWANGFGPIGLTAHVTVTSFDSSGVNASSLLNHRRDGGLISPTRKDIPAFSTGGGWKVRGPGSGISDSILAKLSAGEYVNTARSVKFWGADFFESLNRRMLPASLTQLIGAAAMSNQGPSHITNVSVVQNSPVTRDPLRQLREDSERVAAGIWS